MELAKVCALNIEFLQGQESEVGECRLGNGSHGGAWMDEVQERMGGGGDGDGLCFHCFSGLWCMKVLIPGQTYPFPLWSVFILCPL